MMDRLQKWTVWTGGLLLIDVIPMLVSYFLTANTTDRPAWGSFCSIAFFLLLSFVLFSMAIVFLYYLFHSDRGSRPTRALLALLPMGLAAGGVLLFCREVVVPLSAFFVGLA